MTDTDAAIQTLRAEGYKNQAIIDALCDGEALHSMGLGEADQTDIEDALDELRSKNC